MAQDKTYCMKSIKIIKKDLGITGQEMKAQVLELKLQQSSKKRWDINLRNQF